MTSAKAAGEKRSGTKREHTLQYGLLMSLPGMYVLLLEYFMNIT